MENQTNTEINKQSMEIDHEGLAHLFETRKWTMFLSVLGFIFIGLMIIISLAMIVIGSKGPANVYVTFTMVLLILVVYFFPIYYLFKFSELSKAALANSDSKMMSNALLYLKKHYRFMGIIAIVFIAIYALLFLFAAIAGTMSSIF
jgi:hypothetical protein